MKALLLAAALSSAALAGATHEARTPQTLTDTATAEVIADAGRLGSASLTALHGGRWTPAQPQSGTQEQFGGVDIDNNALLIGVGVIAFLLSRPLSRALRRQAQQRRAVALASTLPRH